MSYKVKLNIFEGPFDLLVYLIENAQMNIYDINVAEIVTQYLEYIDEMERHEIAVATEFMVLAASLIEIKSKMLLPRVSVEGDVVELEDPRTELVEKLLEYKRFKAAAGMLADAEEWSLRIYEKPQEDISMYTEQPDEYLQMDIAQFVNAFNLFLYRKKKVEDVRRHYTRLERQRISIEQKISYIKSFFKRGNRTSVTFDELIEDNRDKYNKVATFTSLLEMAKSRAVGLKQKANFDKIVITKGSTLDELDAAAVAAAQVAEADGQAVAAAQTKEEIR